MPLEGLRWDRCDHPIEFRFDRRMGMNCLVYVGKTSTSRTWDHGELREFVKWEPAKVVEVNREVSGVRDGTGGSPR